MIDIDAKAIIEIGVVIGNGALIFMSAKVKTEISDLKVWIMENFERRKRDRD